LGRNHESHEFKPIVQILNSCDGAVKVNKGYMTFAADMALMRHEKWVNRVGELCEKLELPVLINLRNTNETRIVDKNGKLKAKYEMEWK